MVLWLDHRVRAVVGDLRVTPRPMHVEHHEDVGRAVAAILVVPSRTTARGRSTRHSSLADQLPWGLVDADNRPSRIRGLGVQVQNVLHSRHVFGVDFWDAPHLLLPGFQLLLGQSATYGFAGQTLVTRQLNQPPREQLQRPTRTPFRGSRARDRYQERLLFRRQLSFATASAASRI
jgi:hypothetical protein